MQISKLDCMSRIPIGRDDEGNVIFSDDTRPPPRVIEPYVPPRSSERHIEPPPSPILPWVSPLIIVGTIAVLIFVGINKDWFSTLFKQQNNSTSTPAVSQTTIVTIPNNVTTIREKEYSNKQLTSVTFNIPSSVTSIGNSAFSDNQLTSITIPDSIRTIGQDAFRSNKLTSIIIPNNVREIGMNAFANNPITSVTIGANVTLHFSGNIGILGGNSGFNGAYDRNSSRAGIYTRPNMNSTAWAVPPVTATSTSTVTTPEPNSRTIELNRGFTNQSNLIYLNDFADILSEKTKRYINERSYELIKEKDVHIVIATTRSTGNNRGTDYAIQMYNEWNIGKTCNNNGLLFLIIVSSDSYTWHLRWGNGRVVGNVVGEYITNSIHINGNAFINNMGLDEGILAIYNHLIISMF